ESAGEEEEVVIKEEEAPPPPEFAASEEEIIKRVTLPKSVKIQDVHTARDDLPLTAGQAYLYFFPNGFTEEAVIHLSNEEGTMSYSVLVSPLTGLSRIEKGYVELEKNTEE
ncbi:MAG: hypothetical protein Q7T11_06035, partial [Deltaproteobacteria bacterium]|nr:hypothetical protein [Deltaproteobacteria bacterium]